MPIDPRAVDVLDSWHSDEIPMFEERAISLRRRNLPVQVLFERYGPRVSGDEGRHLIRALIQSGLFVRFFRAVASWRQGAKTRLAWQIWRWAVAVTRRGSWRVACNIRSKQQQQQPGEQP